MAKSLPKKKEKKIKSHLTIYERIHVYDSHSKNVARSLEALVFSRTKEFKQSLTKKRILLAATSFLVLIAMGSYFAPKGAAESAIFYPTSCLGGWMNPTLAQGQPETTSNSDVSQFNPDNSAVLAANTNADIYCGSFKGDFPEKTKPTKILVSLSWAQAGTEAVVSHADTKTNIVGESFASSSGDILDSSSTDASNPVTFTLATSTDATDTPTDTTSTPNDTPVDKAPTAETQAPDQSDTQTPANTTPADVTPTDTTNSAPVNTTPPDTGATTPDASGPSSFLDTLVRHIAYALIEQAHADDQVVASDPAPQDAVVQTDTTPSDVPQAAPTTPDVQSSNDTPVDTPQTESQEPVTGSDASATQAPTIDTTDTSSVDTVPTIDTASTTIEDGSTTEVVAEPTQEVQPTEAENSFLEVLYTFDGVTWSSLGTVNETDMVSRNFEIPVDASTTWDDMSHLQVKVQTIGRIDATPLVYLDGMQAEVMYESVSDGTHPDFSRDTILQETKDSGIHALLITNADTEQNEIWYMLEEPLDGIDLATSTWYQFGDLRQWPTPATILYSLQDHSPPPLNSHKFTRTITTDPNATHTCHFTPFHVDISGVSTSSVKVYFNEDEQGVYKAEIGSLPEGIKVTFARNGGYEDYPSQDDTSLDLDIINESGSDKGNFTMPMIFTKNLGHESIIVCQLNLENL